MPKMSIEDAATHFGISKEAIHNRIRRGSLQSLFENGLKLVVVEENIPHAANKTSTNKTRASSSYGDKYYSFLEEQNLKLQEKVEKLEGETRTLRDQKEQMLIAERVKIEEIYKQKDEQLKSILSSISSQFILQTPNQESSKEGHVEAEIEEIEEELVSQSISLKKYLKQSRFSDSKQEKIKKRFKNLTNDERVLMQGKKIYIDLSKFDYSDIF